jgi:hypothetical protein
MGGAALCVALRRGNSFRSGEAEMRAYALLRGVAGGASARTWSDSSRGRRRGCAELSSPAWSCSTSADRPLETEKNR